MSLKNPEKINKTRLSDIALSLDQENFEKIRGQWLYGKFLISITPFKSSITEKVNFLRNKRKEKALCILCSKKVTEKKKNGKLYFMCNSCRQKRYKK